MEKIILKLSKGKTADLKKLSIKDAAKILKVPQKTIRSHVKAGMPLRKEKINIVKYAAWLLKKSSRKS